jgi:uncharacterized protein YqjF (DUF2071 family)
MTPFLLTGLRPRLLPPLPGLSTFPELNLRTYVRVARRPGVFFFTLEAASRLAVLAARTLYRLPYHFADMRIEYRNGWIHYHSRRTEGHPARPTNHAPARSVNGARSSFDDDAPAEFVARYRPTGPVFNALPGSLEHFLTERYSLYVVLRNRKILRGDIHHRPWPLQPAEAMIERNTIPAAHGITLPDHPPLLHYAERQDTLTWPPTLVEPATP